MGRILLSSVLVLLFAMTGLSQGANPQSPGSLVLLEDFEHRNYVKGALHDGTFWKNAGLKIDYDIGEGADKKNERPVAAAVEWTVKQTINGRELEVVRDKNGLVMACYPAKEMEQTKSYPAIFSSTIKSESQLAEFLATVVTYPAPLIEVPPAEDKKPRWKELENLRLIEGFRHERLQGIDSKPGRIYKEGVLNIKYDIGSHSGNWAAGADEKELVWSIKQVINQRPVHLIKKKNNTMTVTFSAKKDPTERNIRGPYPANFSGEVTTNEQTAIFLLMVLTYPAVENIPIKVEPPKNEPKEVNPLFQRP